MAKKEPAKEKKSKLVRRVNFIQVQKLLAAVALLTFGVVLAAGLMAGASMFSIAWRACLAMLILKMLAVIILKILSTYEELHGGQS